MSRICIVGGGIAGLALAVSLQKHGIYSVLFEKDVDFACRHQGYGLTLQQGGRALKQLGILDAIRAASVSSSSHFIFNQHGQCIVFWGVQEGKEEKHAVWNGNRNLHIARQNLRKVLLDAIDPRYCEIKWNCQITDIEDTGSKVLVTVDGAVEAVACLVGCDGIFSSVRKHLLPKEELRFLGMFVMLGIVDKYPFDLLRDRVVQMSDGQTRIFMMPFDQERYMWQLSFPFDSQDAALALSGASPATLVQRALHQCAGFHSPIPEMLRHTPPALVTGYPVYDREPLAEPFPQHSLVTLLGDAAHPMSPFKGQGANQALLDAVNLAEFLVKYPTDVTAALRANEIKMLARTRSKVLSSRECVAELHHPGFIDTACQMERRGFNSVNNPYLLRNLAMMSADSVGISDPVKLDDYAFRQEL
ncbi:hypothetical protein HDV03_004470 [Kappamyces sp. JEL0829]|nr:hypothetical protein HDV03_004470 [Kappamyces sp. JEL0829]